MDQHHERSAERKRWEAPKIIVSEDLNETRKFTIGFEATTPNGNQYGPNSATS